MEIRCIVIIFWNSAVTKDAHHRHYAELLNEMSAFGSQQALGAETTNNIIVGQASQESNAGDSACMLLVAGQTELLKYKQALTGKTAIFSGSPGEAKSFIKDLKNYTQLISDAKKAR